VRESVIEQHLVDSVKALGGIAAKFKSPQRNNVPDRICLLPRAALWFVECKATGEVPTPAQEREHMRLRNLGYKVIVVDSEASVDGWLKGAM
jgi:hypothetical protein